MTDTQIWEAIECCFTGDEARRMGLSLSLFAREIERRTASTSANVAQGAVAQSVEPVAYFLYDRDEDLWEQVRGDFKDDPDVVPLCRLAAPPAQTALTDDVLMQAIADTAARGHVWASRALSNFRATQKAKP